MFLDLAHKYHFFFIFAIDFLIRTPMKLNFRTLTPEAFDTQFADDEACLSFLAAEKWREGFVCRKCGHDHYCKGKRPFARRCTRCKTEESATAHTPFHHCRIPIKEAFRIAWLCCVSPAISSLSLSKKLEIRQMTCWKFKKKLMLCIEPGKEVSDIA